MLEGKRRSIGTSSEECESLGYRNLRPGISGLLGVAAAFFFHKVSRATWPSSKLRSRGTAGRSLDKWGTLCASRAPVSFSTGWGASLSLSPSQLVLFSQSSYLSIIWSVPLPEWGWTYHSGRRQKKSFWTAGMCSSCSIKGWAWPMVRPLCRLIWSICLDRRGSGIGFL